MSAPSPVISMQTPQREFASAKLLIFFDIHKKICTFDADLLFLIHFVLTFLPFPDSKSTHLILYLRPSYNQS